MKSTDFILRAGLHPAHLRRLETVARLEKPPHRLLWQDSGKFCKSLPLACQEHD
jgi:hypothetical protein